MLSFHFLPELLSTPQYFPTHFVADSPTPTSIYIHLFAIRSTRCLISGDGGGEPGGAQVRSRG
ncbi:hypothetical protein ACG83_29380 [Frankia sp. R43]|nr:hypothetical protein ACG83_29380 [Frankia sp. R43]